ncbi:MAG: membrane protein insertase YidC [Burkholderiaceae bacterium]|nr:MAG: membrane protein insertase YidC [Burkholderiaceae bacterium]
MDIRRTVLWAIFGFALLMLWTNWQQANPRISPQSAATVTSGSGSRDAALPSAPAAANAQNATPTAAAPAAAGHGETIEITTDVLKIDIDTLGGSLVRAELLQQKEDNGSSKNIVLFDAARNYAAQSGLVGVDDAPNHSLYRVVSTARTLEAGKDTLELALETISGGIQDRLIYTFKRGAYAIEVRHEITNQQAQAVTPRLYMHLVRDNSKPENESKVARAYSGPAIYAEEKFHKISFEDIEKGKAKDAIHVAAKDPAWVGMVQHYFVSAWVPEESRARVIYTDKPAGGPYRVGISESLGELAPGATVVARAKLFVGPQDQGALSATAPGLELVVDYGWLTFLAKPIFMLLQWLHKLVGNWGWAIILLTVLIKLAFYPLSAAGYKSMARMKNVTPRLQAMKERYKDDKMKMQQAMMELYREEKINPMGGCLPILIQIPVFISLYWVLLASVEMRNAPWMGWIHDLAAPDPLYILPVVMMASMFLQTKLNPTPPDPVQAKIMLFMPLIFGTMFFFFPSGLVLYWVVNNILSIAQQWRINTQLVKAGLK